MNDQFRIDKGIPLKKKLSQPVLQVQMNNFAMEPPVDFDLDVLNMKLEKIGITTIKMGCENLETVQSLLQSNIDGLKAMKVASDWIGKALILIRDLGETSSPLTVGQLLDKFEKSDEWKALFKPA